MNYQINIPEFEGPLDLLLHLIKEANISIFDISIDDITKQYLNYIEMMDQMNLNIASEYLVMAAELIEMKSRTLLPNTDEEIDDYEEDPKEKLINRLLEYEKYKAVSKTFQELETFRKEVYTKNPENLLEYQDEVEDVDYGVNLDDLLNAFSKFLTLKEFDKPLNTKITNKEYSVSKRSLEIRDIIRKKKRVEFKDLFESYSKNYIVVTFLAILNLSRKQEIEIEQENNFKNIYIKGKVM